MLLMQMMQSRAYTRQVEASPRGTAQPLWVGLQSFDYDRLIGKLLLFHSWVHSPFLKLFIVAKHTLYLRQVNSTK